MTFEIKSPDSVEFPHQFGGPPLVTLSKSPAEMW